MQLVLLMLLPFFGAILAAAAAGSSRRTVATALACLPAVLGVAILIDLAPAAMAGDAAEFRADWVPALGLDLSLRIDALAWLFAALILGIGLLIVVYARFYLPPDEDMSRFLSLLLLFQGAMLGIAVSGNVLLLLVFWELTSLTSFLLIGFRRHRPESRQGARMALVVTGGGGLALIAGLVLLGHIAGSFELADILASGATIRSSPQYPLALVLILVGCFTKSAQFPFHFWLPHAMAAPTPVSAYLHSATMVKAGVFLLARFWPVLSGTELWFYLVATTGLITMLIGAAVALFRHDLKAILAYSTVSHLGLLTMLFGFGTPAAAAAGLFHLVNHALFKAALFMNAGIVDHQAGSRDIRRLGGLARLMPITATLGIVAAASMAGIPPLGGFLSKEMMLEEAAHTAWIGHAWTVPILATLAAGLSAAYSLRFVSHLYLGRRPSASPVRPSDPPLGLWAPSALLVILTVLVGLFPQTLTAGLIQPAAAVVTGGRAPAFEPALWHGLTPALGLSVAALVIGMALVWRYAPLLRAWDAALLPDAKRAFDLALDRLVRLTRIVTGAIHSGSLQRQLWWLFAAAIALGVTGAGSAALAPGARATIPAPPMAVVAWLILLGGVIAVVCARGQRFVSLIYLGVVGLMVALAFAYLSAPDLALTQISVEVVTVLLLLLALNLLPKQPSPLSSRSRRLRDTALALAGGGATGFAAWAVMTRDTNAPISAYHWANSYAHGGGTNVVNVTLVDFRAFDTFGEIIVLGIAALTIFALLQPATRGVSGQRLRAWVAELPRSPERHPLMFAVAARLLLPLAAMVGAYVFLRGHNLPGGGFIAGLVVSVAMLMQYMASGFAWTERRRRIDEHLLIGLGVGLAALTGLGSLAFGAPLFTSSFGHFAVPLIGEFELATAMLFDLGVALTVIGAVMLALAELSHVAQRTEHEPADGNPGALRRGVQ